MFFPRSLCGSQRPGVFFRFGIAFLSRKSSMFSSLPSGLHVSTTTATATTTTTTTTTNNTNANHIELRVCFFREVWRSDQAGFASRELRARAKQRKPIKYNKVTIRSKIKTTISNNNNKQLRHTHMF